MNYTYLIIGIFALILIIITVRFILSRLKGKIDIVPSKYSFSGGEDITGRIVLKLNKPIEAESLTIGLIGERTDTNLAKKDNNTSSAIIFNFSQPIDGKKLYTSQIQEYNFSIKAPNQAALPQGIAGTIIKSAMILSGNSTQIRWNLIAELHCQGVNVTKKVRINIV